MTIVHYDTGVREVDLSVLNPVLRRAGGVELAYRQAEGSSRLVKVKVEEAHYEAGPRFWLQAAAPEAAPSSGGLVPRSWYA